MSVTVIARAAAEPTVRNLRFIDIGGKVPSFPMLERRPRYDNTVNLTDPVFRGYHHGKKKHDGTDPNCDSPQESPESLR